MYRFQAEYWYWSHAREEGVMRYRRRSVSYAGQPYSFERVEGWASGERRVVWAVSHRGEFIGTMNSSEEITTKDFDLRCAQWLADLLGSARPRA